MVGLPKDFFGLSCFKVHLYSWIFLGGGTCAHDMWKFPGQGSNPDHSSDPSHSNDNTGSLTRWVTRGLLESLALCLDKFGKFSAIISSATFSTTFSFFSLCFPGTLMIWRLSYIPMGLWVSVYFCLVYFLSIFSYWVNSIDLSSCSLTHSSIISTSLETICQVYCFRYHVFQLNNLYNVNFYYFYFFAEIFILSHLFQENL